MALRARRRQGGSPNGRTVGTVISKPGQGASIGAQARPVGAPAPKKGLGSVPIGGGTKPTVTTPSASYARVPVPPGPSVPTRGATSEAMRANAQSTLGIAKTQNRDAVFRAIMNLGDTSQFAKYKADPNFAGYDFTQDPNSLFASLARQETQGLEDIDKGTLGGNTFFSGMRLNNRQKITDETGRQRLGGTTAFGDDLKKLAASMGLAEGDYGRSISEADQMDIDAALERDRVAREDFDDSVATAQAQGPVKGTGLPLTPRTTPATPQQQNAAYLFAQRMKAQEAERRARSRRR